MTLPFESGALKASTSTLALLSKFDFTQPGTFETFENGTVIGFNGENDVSYAPHDLAEADETTVATVSNGATDNIPGGAIAAVPYTGQIEARVISGTGGLLEIGGSSEGITLFDWTVVKLTGIPAVTETMRVVADAVAVIEYRAARYCEGPDVFIMSKSGFARYLVRKFDGIGRLNEPEITQRCLAANIAAQDLSGVVDGTGAVTTWVERENLPADLLQKLNSFDYKSTMQGLYRTAFTGLARAYCAGPAADAITDYSVRGLFYVENGTGGPSLEDFDFVDSPVGELNPTHDKAVPLLATDRWSVHGTNAVIYWGLQTFYNSQHKRSFIPSAGALRTRQADAPLTGLSALGIDADLIAAGITIVDVWDTFRTTFDFERTWRMYGSSPGTDEITALPSSGGNQNNGYIAATIGGVTEQTVGTTSIIGLHTQQTALKDGDSEFWIDQVSQGAITPTLTSDLDTIMLGNNPLETSRIRDGIQKSIAFYNGRATEPLT